LDMAPLIWAPEGLQPSWTTRCSAHTSGLPTIVCHEHERRKRWIAQLL